jgi:lambda family phage portal protein
VALEPLDLTEARLSALANRKPRRLMRRSFSAAQLGRLTEDWQINPFSRDQKLWNDLRKLRGRARELADNDATAAKFLSMVVSNVVGDCGVLLQAKVKKLRGNTQATALNQQIEELWEDWTARGICTADGTMSFVDVQGLFARTVALDGECIIQKVKSAKYPFQLKFIDADQLDSTFFLERTQSGSEIRQGVEIDPVTRKPLAYWIWNKHPTEWSSGPRYRQRIPADQIYHCFIPDSAAQTRGVPWMAPVMFLMNMLKGYKEAEVTAARTSSAKMGFIQSDLGTDADFTGTDAAATGGVNTDDTRIMEAAAGIIDRLNPGEKFASWDPQHPTAAFPFFVKAVGRSIAAGLNVAYNSLYEDLEGVNFSSIRAGLLNERDNWKVKQRWMIDQFLRPVCRDWLEMAMLSGQLDLSAYEFEEVVEQIEWHPRSWPWVDPFKDLQANTLAVDNGFTTRTRVLAEQGYDFEDTMMQLKEEQDLIEKLGVKIGSDIKGVADTAGETGQATATGGQ